MGCPSCGSDEWKLASFIYKQGLQHVNTNTTTIGAGVGSGGLGAGVAEGATNGTHQTALSIAAAPPPAPAEGGMTALVGVIFIAAAIYFIDGFWPIAGIGLIGFILGAALETKALAEPKATHQAAMQKWEKTRMCQRCGTLYLEE